MEKQRGKYVERLPHSCGTTRGLQVFREDDGRYTGYCFSCHTHVKDPYSDKDASYTPPEPQRKSPEQIQKEVEFIKKLPIEGLPDLKIKKHVMQHFGVRLGYDQETASVVQSHYYPYTAQGKVQAFQARTVPDKRFFFIGDVQECDPFGWDQAVQAGGFKLFITEGQKDALALFQVLSERGKSDRPPAVISLHHGTKTVDKLSKYTKDFDRWKQVVYCGDQDEAGKAAAQAFCKMYPKAVVANFSLKDAHDMLMEGREQELFNSCVWEAKRPLSDKLVRSSDVWDDAMKRPEDGLSWPWPGLTTLTRGIRRGEGYYFGAGGYMPAINSLNCWEPLT